MKQTNIKQIKLKAFFNNTLDDTDVLQNNEIQANKLTGFVMFLGSIILAVVLILSMAGLFQIRKETIGPLVFQGMLELLIPAIICRAVKARKLWLKYVLIIELLIVLARIDSMLMFNSVLIMVIPVVLSSRFFSKRFTVLISVLTAILFAASSFANAWMDTGSLDLNFYEPPVGTVLTVTGNLQETVRAAGIDRMVRLKQVMILSYLPKLLVFVLIAVICVKIAEKGRMMVEAQESITRKTARIESELNLANSIQAHMLPTIFPPYPECEEVDLYASMKPARAVGGDFYDFFMLDDKHLAMVMADVSGKGIPAALFMVIAKTLIKNEVMMGTDPAEVFGKVNHMLCEGNENDMFVTAWLGILDTEKGILTYVNAGHNPPVIKTGSSAFEYLKMRGGFVLGGMDGMKYRQRELVLQPGDRLFLYTDGVTEADRPDGSFYGDERLLAFLNSHDEKDLESILKDLSEDIDKFAEGAEQADDITMMMMEYRRRRESDELMERKFLARVNQLEEVSAYVEQVLEEAGCPPKTSMQISVCAEEIFVNIAKYAYTEKEEDVSLGIKCEDGQVIMRFTDHGIPYDPLAKKDPDVKLSAEEREIGGLGIYLVKKNMDDVQYKYQNGKNILTLTKNYEKAE